MDGILRWSVKNMCGRCSWVFVQRVAERFGGAIGLKVLSLTSVILIREVSGMGMSVWIRMGIYGGVLSKNSG